MFRLSVYYQSADWCMLPSLVTWDTPPIQTPLWVGPPAGWCALTHNKSSSVTALGAQQRAHVVNLTSTFSRSQSSWASLGHAGTSPIHGGPTPQHTGPKGSTTNITVPDTTGHPQRCYDHALTGQSCTRGTCTIKNLQVDGFYVVADQCLLVRRSVESAVYGSLKQSGQLQF